MASLKRRKQTNQYNMVQTTGGVPFRRPASKRISFPTSLPKSAQPRDLKKLNRGVLRSTLLKAREIKDTVYDNTIGLVQKKYKEGVSRSYKSNYRAARANFSSREGVIFHPNSKMGLKRGNVRSGLANLVGLQHVKVNDYNPIALLKKRYNAGVSRSYKSNYRAARANFSSRTGVMFDPNSKMGLKKGNVRSGLAHLVGLQHVKVNDYNPIAFLKKRYNAGVARSYKSNYRAARAGFSSKIGVTFDPNSKMGLKKGNVRSGLAHLVGLQKVKLNDINPLASTFEYVKKAYAEGGTKQVLSNYRALRKSQGTMTSSMLKQDIFKNPLLVKRLERGVMRAGIANVLGVQKVSGKKALVVGAVVALGAALGYGAYKSLSKSKSKTVGAAKTVGSSKMKHQNKAKAALLSHEERAKRISKGLLASKNIKHPGKKVLISREEHNRRISKGLLASKKLKHRNKVR